VEITIVADAGTLFALCDIDKIAQPPLLFYSSELLGFNDTFLAWFCQTLFLLEGKTKGFPAQCFHFPFQVLISLPYRNQNKSKLKWKQIQNPHALSFVAPSFGSPDSPARKNGNPAVACDVSPTQNPFL